MYLIVALRKLRLARRISFGLLIGVVMLVLSHILAQNGAHTVTMAAAPPASPKHVALKPAAAEPLVVKVGLYPMMLYDLNIDTSSYYLDAYMWMTWKESTIDPVATMEFANAVDLWGQTITPVYETPMQLPDGMLLQQLHIQGRFFHPFTLSKYPLDQHDLDLTIENNTYYASDLVYVPDEAESGVSDHLLLPGWNVTGWDMNSDLHVYNTTMGDTTIAGQESSFSSLTYKLNIQRPVNFFVWKLLMPLLIVLVLGLSALIIHPDYSEVRLAVPATAMLTLVLLQQAYTNALPEMGYLVLLDKIYLLAYFLIIAVMVQTIISSNALKKNADSLGRMIRIDRLITLGLVALFVAGTGLLVAIT